MADSASVTGASVDSGAARKMAAPAEHAPAENQEQEARLDDLRAEVCRMQVEIAKLQSVGSQGVDFSVFEDGVIPLKTPEGGKSKGRGKHKGKTKKGYPTDHREWGSWKDIGRPSLRAPLSWQQTYEKQKMAISNEDGGNNGSKIEDGKWQMNHEKRKMTNGN